MFNSGQKSAARCHMGNELVESETREENLLPAWRWVADYCILSASETETFKTALQEFSCVLHSSN